LRLPVCAITVYALQGFDICLGGSVSVFIPRQLRLDELYAARQAEPDLYFGSGVNAIDWGLDLAAG